MADCVGVSSNRNNVLITYPSEPILAEVAANHICGRYPIFLAHLQRLIQSGVGEGEGGGSVTPWLQAVRAGHR